jgi:3-deoxy-D-manno-octulosonic-acid transferase
MLVMQLIYEFAIRCYSLIIRIVAPFNLKAHQWVEGRKNIFDRLNSTLRSGDRIAWFHSASLGEFEQGRPVIEEFRKRYPDVKILLTFFSPSGYEIRKNYQGADYIFYLPADTRSNAIRFIESVKPEMVFFIKYEFWYNYLNQLQKRNIPVYLFSAIFRPEQVFFKWYGKMFRRVLRGFRFIFVQNEESVSLLKSIGAEHVKIAGDTRFDRVAQIASQTRKLPVAEVFCGSFPILIAGSTWPSDEELLIRYLNQCKHSIKAIIAPHEIEKPHIEQIMSLISRPAIRYSEAEGKDLSQYDILVIDNIGMLSSLYQYGSMAYIGGGFGKGIHNTLEAATFGLPVLFGPNYHKFAEARDLIGRSGAFCISDYTTLSEQLDWFFTNIAQCKLTGKIASDYVSEKTGASCIILDSIKQ